MKTKRFVLILASIFMFFSGVAILGRLSMLDLGLFDMLDRHFDVLLLGLVLTTGGVISYVMSFE